MRVWKVIIENSPTFHIAAETSNDAAAAAKILYAAIADSPEDARTKFYQEGHSIAVTEVCKLDSITMPSAAMFELGPVKLQDYGPHNKIDLENIMSRAAAMLEQIRLELKRKAVDG